MTDVQRKCTSSNPDALQPLKALAAVAGVSSITFTANDDGGGGDVVAVTMTVTARNTFTQTETTSVHEGFVDCVKVLSNIIPESGLWTKEEERTGGCWVGKAWEALGSVAYGGGSGSDEEQVSNFFQSMEEHLTKTNTPFLNGSSPTSSDIVCSFLLVASATSITSTGALGEKTSKLITTIFTHPVITDCISTSSLTESFKSLTLGGGDGGDGAPPPTTTTTSAEEESSSGGTASYESVEESEVESNTILTQLKSLNVPYTVYKHKLSMTADELVTNVPLPPSSTKESHTKNLLFKDKKHGIFLITAKASSTNTSNTKEIGKLLGLQGKINLRLADEKTLDLLLGVKKGCVGPLTVGHDTANQVTLVFDKELLDLDYIHSHPGRNDWSVKMTPDDLVKACGSGMGHEPVIIEFGKGADGDEGALAGKVPSNRPPSTKQTPKGGGGGDKKQQKQQQQQKAKNKDKKEGKKGETLLALKWKKTENFPMWYSDVIVLSEMIAYYDISGCYILRPWSYKIWEIIQDYANDKIRALGVENSYFPLFVSQDRLEKEKDHVEGFAPEVAWVTKSGESDLVKQIAIRPTSETIMYPAFSDWIKSHRDLPLKLNQWSNVVRWEFKDPTPFLRTREFLWQEGHTAHSTFEEADEMVMDALELYRSIYEHILAVPVIKGYKTEKEKFAGGHQTTTVEAYIPLSGRAIQGATSHNLGQNFGKMFDITFQDEKGETKIAWQTSWGLTTRTIGVMVMVHGDDQGLVLPPRVAPLQIVIVPIVSKKLPAEVADPYCKKLLDSLLGLGIRAKFDNRVMYNPGWKYNHWEQKGVPLRIEVGPRDIEQNQVRLVTRYNGEKEDLPVEGLAEIVKTKLVAIQDAMFEKVKKERDTHVVQVTEWKDFVPNLEKHNLVLTPWIGGEHQDWEEWVKKTSREESLKEGEEEEDTAATSVAAKTLCIPFAQPDLPEGTKCIASGEPAKCWVLWGRSY